MILPYVLGVSGSRSRDFLHGSTGIYPGHPVDDDHSFTPQDPSNAVLVHGCAAACQLESARGTTAKETLSAAADLPEQKQRPCLPCTPANVKYEVKYFFLLLLLLLLLDVSSL